jgi:hypothetical protein
VEAGSFSVDGSPGSVPASGEWIVSVANQGAEAAVLHGWVSRRYPMRVAWKQGYDPGTELGAPATAHEAIAVGSFNTKTCWQGLEGEECSLRTGEGTEPGQASWFTSRGPTLDGRMKPEVAAPGYAVMSSFAGTMAFPVRPLWGIPQTLSDDGVHVMQAGTSMSAPHVTGAVALALAESPLLSPEEMIERLRQSARSTSESVWSPALGYGTLDVARLLSAQDVVLPPPPPMQAAPNPFREFTRLALWGSSTEEALEATVYDLSGRVIRVLDLNPGAYGVRTADWDGRRDTGEFAAAGVYWVRVRTRDRTGVLKVIKLP